MLTEDAHDENALLIFQMTKAKKIIFFSFTMEFQRNTCITIMQKIDVKKVHRSFYDEELKFALLSHLRYTDSLSIYTAQVFCPGLPTV